MTVPVCEYPGCDDPQVGGRRYRVPEPPGVGLCSSHNEMLDRDDHAEDPDFWRWAIAMLHPGAG